MRDGYKNAASIAQFRLGFAAFIRHWAIMRLTYTCWAMMGLIGLAGCTSAPVPPPRPAPPPQSPPPARLDWRDLPETAGRWRYTIEAGGTSAQFGPAEAPLFTIRCERASRSVALHRLTAAAGAMTITSSFSARSLVATGEGGSAVARLPAVDPFLDQLAFSRGRFTVEAQGAAELVLPVWAEPARVIEDCRS